MIRSIRWRIQIGYAVFLLLAVVIAGCTLYIAWKQEAERMLPLKIEVDTSRFIQELSPYVRPPSQGGPLMEGEFRPSNPEAFDPAQPYPYYYVIWDKEGAVLYTSSYVPPGVTKPEFTAVGDDAQRGQREREGFLERYEFSRRGRHCILVGRSMRSIESSLRPVAWSIVAAGTAIVVAGLALGWWVARNAMRPLQQIGQAAQRIASGDLRERINVLETETELGSLAMVLNDAFARLESAVEHEARFASDAAHELRTPVTVILAETQTALERQGTDDDQREAIHSCRRAAQRMQALIESLLELARVENATAPLDRQSCDLASLAEDAQEIMRFIAGEKNIHFTNDLQPARCHADSERLLQAALNLLANAVKFSPDGSEVTIRTGSDDASAFFAVEDRGCGIGSEHLDHLFERFYRVDRSRNRTTGGAGLGLAICKSLVEAHGGRFTVTSTLGGGSSFTFFIPRESS
jgi:heavy metal sensor kinase